jgi:Family of unknown function (DUF5994)
MTADLPSAPDDVGPSLRLRLGAELNSGRLDGAWWPRSYDLAAEFADLAENFPDGLGRIVHLTYSKRRWSTAEPWLKAGRGRLVRTGQFLGTADADRVLLRMDSQRSLQLLVVPPDADPADAGWAMAAAASRSNTSSATDILAAAAAQASTVD